MVLSRHAGVGKGWPVASRLAIAGLVAVAPSPASSANAVITGGSTAAVAQPGATQRFFRATADRTGTWSLGTTGNAADFTIDPATGIYSVKASAAGDGTAQIVKTLPIAFTPADGTMPVGQTVTVTLTTVAAPAALSAAYQSNFAGPAGSPYPAGKNIATLPGWQVSGGSTMNIATDGGGNIVGTGVNADGVGVFQSPPQLGGQTATLSVSKGATDYHGVTFFVAAQDANNGVAVFVYPKSDGLEIHSIGMYQAGVYTDLGHNGFAPWPASNTGTITTTVSADGNTLVVGGNVGGAFSFPPIDLTGKVKGPKLGFAGHVNEDNGSYGMTDAHPVASLIWAVRDTGLTAVRVPGASPDNKITCQLAWDTTLNRPTGIQHSQDAGVTWITGDATINNDGTIVYAATTSGAANIPTLQFRPLNDTGIIVSAPNVTRFSSPPAKFGANISQSQHGWYNPYDPQFQIFDDIFIQGLYATTDSSDPATKVGSDGMPTVGDGTLVKHIGRGPNGAGETLEMTWTGAPGMNVTVGVVGGTINYSNVTYPTPQSMRWTETYTYDGASACYGQIHFDNFDPANPPKNIHVRAIALPAPQHPPFSDAYIAFQSTFNGPIRLMDVLNTNQRLDGSASFAADQFIIESAITLCNATGRDLWYNIPLFSSQAYVTAAFNAFLTGAGTTTGVGLNAGLTIFAEAGNENWDYQFATPEVLKTYYSARTGQAVLADNNGGTNQTVAEWVYQHKTMFGWVAAAFPTYMRRIVRVLNTQIEGAWYDFLKAAGIGSADYDANANAPYFGVPTNPDKSPAALGLTWGARSLAVMQGMQPMANETYADGKRFICYEGGPDYDNTDIDPTSRAAFKASQAFYDVMHAYYQYWKDMNGDVFCQYTDMSLDTWGVYQYQGVASPSGYNALIDVIAGNSAHRPTS